MRQNVLADQDGRQVKQFHPLLGSGDLGFPLEILCEDLNDVLCRQSPLFALHPLSLCPVVEDVKLAGHAEPDVVLSDLSGHGSCRLVLDDPPEASLASLLNLQQTFGRQQILVGC